MTSCFTNLLILISLFIVSCGLENKESAKDKLEVRYDEQKLLDSINMSKAEKISKSLNALTGWDTKDYFTYSIQELFETTSKPISFIGIINDIIKRDTTYLLKVTSSNYHSYKTFIAEISVSADMFKELKSKLDPIETNEGCFIFQVSKVSSSQPVLKSEIESNGDNVEDATSYITFDFDETLIKFQGKLITYFIYNRLKENVE